MGDEYLPARSNQGACEEIGGREKNESVEFDPAFAARGDEAQARYRTFARRTHAKKENKQANHEGKGMTEITLPWVLVVAFFISSGMAAYHIGRSVERVRRHRRSVSWEELWIKKMRSRAK